jgi:hypothetical protein
MKSGGRPGTKSVAERFKFCSKVACGIQKLAIDQVGGFQPFFNGLFIVLKGAFVFLVVPCPNDCRFAFLKFEQNHGPVHRDIEKIKPALCTRFLI